ncbi:MAG: hypothetical protein PF961_22695 [Planctomycetota bacterium]|jgi:hypothetical protein|nr:hypothetical protein [Planctomycetota bacterium]
MPTGTNPHLHLEWCQADRKPLLLATFDPAGADHSGTTSADGITFTWSVRHDGQGQRISAEAAVDKPLVRCGYLQLRWQAPGAPLWSFDGPISKTTCLRQSPRNPAIHAMRFPIQSAPLAAIEQHGELLALCGHCPERDDNASTQYFDPATGSATIASGDAGINSDPEQHQQFAPSYHQVWHGHPSRFEAVLFRCAADQRALRLATYRAVAACWGSDTSSDGGAFADLCFALNHLLLRRNETGMSQRWVAAGICYANKQYARDGFWQAWVLSPDDDHECYRGLSPDRFTSAENPLIKLIWAGRLQRRGCQVVVDDALRAALKLLETGLDQAGAFRSVSGTGRGDFRSWYDLCAFTDSDVVTYNQGLAAVALRVASELGLQPSTDHRRAAAAYRAQFDDSLQAFPLSAEKRAFAVDALAGDLLSWCLWGEGLLEPEQVAAHYRFLDTKARTEHGYRVTCAADGSVLPGEFYSIAGHHSHCERASAGSYQRGGSWLLYDLLCLLSCCAHQIPGAHEALLWRLGLDLECSATLNEHLNTETGAACKPNQGWNAMVVPAWAELAAHGRVPADGLRRLDALCQPPAAVASR